MVNKTSHPTKQMLQIRWVCAQHHLLSDAISILWSGQYRFNNGAVQGYAAAQFDYGFWRLNSELFESILKEQHIISSLLLIKKMLLLETSMEFVCRKVKVLELIWQFGRTAVSPRRN
jgi:hypothetical protein